MDAIKLLTQQHREVERLFSEIEQADGEEQADLFAQLADSFLIHSKIEEEIFYPAAFEEKTEDELREAVEEHLQAKRLLADMLELEPSDEQWTAKCSVLREDIKHHVQEEESVLFPQLQKSMTKKRLDELGREMSERARELEQEEAPRELVFRETDAAVLPVPEA